MKSKGYTEGGNLQATYADLFAILDNFGSFDLICALGAMVFPVFFTPAKNKILKSNVTGVVLDIPV